MGRSALENPYKKPKDKANSTSNIQKTSKCFNKNTQKYLNIIT